MIANDQKKDGQISERSIDDDIKALNGDLFRFNGWLAEYFENKKGAPTLEVLNSKKNDIWIKFLGLHERMFSSDVAEDVQKAHQEKLDKLAHWAECVTALLKEENEKAIRREELIIQQQGLTIQQQGLILQQQSLDFQERSDKNGLINLFLTAAVATPAAVTAALPVILGNNNEPIIITSVGLTVLVCTGAVIIINRKALIKNKPANDVGAPKPHGKEAIIEKFRGYGASTTKPFSQIQEKLSDVHTKVSNYGDALCKNGRAWAERRYKNAPEIIQRVGNRLSSLAHNRR